MTDNRLTISLHMLINISKFAFEFSSTFSMIIDNTMRWSSHLVRLSIYLGIAVLFICMIIMHDWIHFWKGNHFIIVLLRMRNSMNALHGKYDFNRAIKSGFQPKPKPPHLWYYWRHSKRPEVDTHRICTCEYDISYKIQNTKYQMIYYYEWYTVKSFRCILRLATTDFIWK